MQGNNLFEGILLIDKPSGCTSHDVVDRVRRKLKMRRIGHAGTLDPIATGLLIMLVGKATKVSQYLMSLSKTYEGVLELGKITDSHDREGTLQEEHPIPDLSEDQFKGYMADFLGDQYQTPPMFSAKKVQGQPLYKMARKGKTVEREPRFINVAQFDLLNFNPPSAKFLLSCSKGTYVRTIVHDLGNKIGCGAILTDLRRTVIGDFDISRAITLEQLDEASSTQIKQVLIPIHRAVPSYAC